ncbi:MAG: ATPase [Bacteroidales bacterium]|nr:ATPase [Bacteroidales bacterium]
MYSNRLFFGSKNRAKIINTIVRPAVNTLVLLALLVLVILAISKIGFTQEAKPIMLFGIEIHNILFTVVAIVYLTRSYICIGFRSFNLDFLVFSTIGLFILLFITLNLDRNIIWLNNFHFYSLLSIALFTFELSRFDIRIASHLVNPAQLFMISFGFIIISGSLFLMLPKATTHPISFVDALFTSTSAVCVTGLTVVDTATDFTLLGKAIILVLIQVGGIGIMTFTSFFGYFFKGGSASFSEKFLISDMLSEDNVAEIAKTFIKVVLITLLIEAIGAISIYLSLDPVIFPTIEKKIHIAVFHSISAFCNAGFSTLRFNIADSSVCNNIPLLYSISFLIIFGGIGFPILLNIYSYIKIKLHRVYSLIIKRNRKSVIPQLININSQLVLVTTAFLLIAGTIFFFIFENHNTLEGMTLSKKIAHAFFSSVTPRTAGFNSVDYARVSVAAVVLTIFLMWVGASPVSTGGGIKTTTFAIAILNTLRIARMKTHIEFHKREIHERSVNRAFAIIIISILILGCSSLLMHLLEPDKSPLQILFECVSAFGTVGLSLGITPYLKDVSKLLLVVLMFTGRVGILSLLFTFFRKAKPPVYRYPKENILIT